MRSVRYIVLAVMALTVTFVAAAATTLNTPSKKVLVVHAPSAVPAPLPTTSIAPAPDVRSALEAAPPVSMIEPITDGEDPAVVESPEIANNVIAHASAEALLPPPPVGTTPQASSPPSADVNPPAKPERRALANDTPANTRAAVTRNIREQMLELMLCTSGNDNYCLMGNESSFWVGETGMTRMSESQIANVIRHDGGYAALCVRGTLMSFEATDQDPDTGLWRVDIRHIDTSLSTASTWLPDYNDGQQIWLGAVRDAPSVNREPPRRKIDRGNTERGLDGYNDGKKIWRGAMTPSE